MRSHPFTFTLVLLVLLFLIPSVSAFSDNFNDCDVTDWTQSGTWNAINTIPNFDGTCYANIAVAGSDVMATKTNDASNFVSFDYLSTANIDSYVNSNFYIYYQCNVNCVQYSGFGATAHTFAAVTTGSTTYVPFTFTSNYKYHIEITKVGTSRRANISNYSTGVILNDQTYTITEYQNSYIRIYAHSSNNNAYFKIDNINTADAPIYLNTYIAWQSSAYTVGDSPVFNWSIKDSDWNSHPLQIYVARLYKAGIMQDWGTFNWICLCSSQLAVAQSGSYVISADVPGTYQVTLELMNPITGTSPVTDSSTSVHAQSSSYFNIPSSVFIKTNTTATYHIGVGGRTGAIDWYFLNNGIEEREAGKILTGTDGTVNITFSRIGTYNVYLKSITGIAETFQMHTVVTSFIPSTPTNNFSTNSITLIPVNGTGGSYGSYHMNEVLFGNYSIKASVFAGEGTFFLDIFNNDAQAITTTYYGSGGTSIGYNDFGTFALVISNNANDVLKTHWIPGNNSVRLRIQYPNGTLATLAMDTFSLSKLTISGYGLDVTPLQVSINQPVTATATSPESNSTLVITGANGYSKTYSLPAGTTTLTTSFNQPGIYGFNLYSSFGYLAMSTQVTVSTAAITPTPSTPANTRTLDFISSGSFLALIIFVTIIGLGGALAGAVGFLVGTFASIPLLYLAGLIPLWLVFLDAGIVFFGLAIVVIHQLTKSS